MTLYKFTKNDIEPRFALIKDNIIQNQTFWRDWQKISNEDALIRIRSLDFSEKTAMGTATVVTTTTATAMSPWKPGRSLAMDYKEFLKLWNENRKIPGNVFLHPNGKLIWISNIDLKYFEKLWLQEIT